MNEAVKYSVPYLTHYTTQIETLLAITRTGLAKPQCDRPVLKALGFPPFYRVFGIVSLTEIGFERSASHRRTYGSFGVALTREWARRMHLQPVVYIPRSGVLFEFVSRTLLTFRNAIDHDWREALPLTEKLASIVVPTKFEQDRIEAFRRKFQQLNAWDLPRILVNYVEFDDLRHEMEWRGISTRHPYDSSKKWDQIASATQPMSPETHGWHHVFQTDTQGTPNDHFGLLKDWPATPFKPADVAFFCCPAANEASLRDSLPAPFRDCDIRLTPRD